MTKAEKLKKRSRGPNDEAKKLKFLLVAHLEGMSFNPAKPSGIELKRGGRSHVVVTLAPADPEKDPFGNRLGFVCKIKRSYQVSKEIFEFMDRLNARVFTVYPGMKITLPHIGERSGRELIASDGTLAEGYRLAWKHHPEDLKAICQTALDELRAETLRSIKQIMWFFNLSHLNDPLRRISLYCNTRGADYHLVNYPEAFIAGRWQNDIIWSDDNSSGFISLWSKGT